MFSIVTWGTSAVNRCHGITRSHFGANCNDQFPPVGHLKLWWKVRESAAKSLNSGLGMIIICPDQWVFLSSLNILVLLFDVYILPSWQSDPPSRMIWNYPPVWKENQHNNLMKGHISQILCFFVWFTVKSTNKILYKNTIYTYKLNINNWPTVLCTACLHSGDNTWSISLPRRFPLKEFLLVLQRSSLLNL